MAIIPITQQELPGVVVVNVVAILATLAISSILGRILWLGILRLHKRNITQTREYVFFHTQLGYYAACLLIANMFSSIAGLMGLPFLSDRAITEGSLCTAQALTMQFSNISTAYFTCTIAIHTFTSLVLRRRQSVIVYSIAISFGWALAALLSSLPLFMPQPNGPIYGEYNLTCGVKDEYPTHQFLLHLLPIFVASVVSVTLYSLIFLVLRGTLVIKGGVKLTLNPNERWDARSGENYHSFVAGIARSMLWYPVAYVVLLVPYSITKLLVLSGFFVAFQGLILAYVCWFLLGVANVLLLYNTFRMVYPAFDTTMKTAPQDVESFPSMKFQAVSYNSSNINRPIVNPTPDSFQSDTPSYPEKALTLPSFYNYDSPQPQETAPVTFQSHPYSIDFDQYRSESVESTVPPSHSRQESTASFGSLPVPPRRIRSPAQSSRNSPSPTSEPSSTRRLLTPSRNSEAIASRSSTELLNDISRWVAQQRPDGSMPLRDGTARTQPMLSAVKPAFSPSSARSRVQSPQERRPDSTLSTASTGEYVTPQPTTMASVPKMGPPPVGRYSGRTHVRADGSF